MTRLILTLLVSAPMLATTSLGQDAAYYHAAHDWEHASPVTYYTHTLLILALLGMLVLRMRRYRARCP